MAKRIISLIFFAFTYISNNVEILEAIKTGGLEDVAAAVLKPQRFSPQVVFQCGYRNRYLSKDGTGEWVTDKDPHAGCLKGKFDILKYCRKAYPGLEITNIVESTHFYEISDWCKLDGQSCKWSFWVNPYRCIVGEFESEALLVPESCHFGHVDERNFCKDFDYWNRTAHGECAKRESTPTVKSFAMLEPCGLGMFSGVEFVCCPRSLTTTESEKSVRILEPKVDLKVKVKLDNNQQDIMGDEYDEEDYSDEDDEDDEGSDEEDVEEISTPASSPIKLPTKRPATIRQSKKLRTTNTTVKPPTPTTAADEMEDDDDDEDDEDSDSEEELSAIDDQDPYFRTADPDKEHGEYLTAIERLEKRHREKVARVMKEWSELESRYEEMKQKDPHRGEQFRNEMTSRFQRTVAALEEENRNERGQIDEVHQQRIDAALNERKRVTLKLFRDALTVSNPQSQKVLRALQAYIRAEEKDRIHSLNRYRRILRTDDADAAISMKAELVKKLKNIDLRINATMEMLKEAPGIERKVKPAIQDFWRRFREENSPKLVNDTPISMENTKNGDPMLESYKKQYQNEYKAQQQQVENDASSFETNDDKQEEISQTKSESGPIVSSSMDNEKEGTVVVKPVVIDGSKGFFPQEDNEEQRFIPHEDMKQGHAFALKETIQHEMAMREEISRESARTSYGYIVVGVAGATLLMAMLGAGVFIRRRYSARGKGFVEVDSCVPEERHVASMQVRGYENPTYKYFDEKA